VRAEHVPKKAARRGDETASCLRVQKRLTADAAQRTKQKHALQTANATDQVTRIVVTFSIPFWLRCLVVPNLIID